VGGDSWAAVAASLFQIRVLTDSGESMDLCDRKAV
jgi:hypothetical protein